MGFRSSFERPFAGTPKLAKLWKASFFCANSQSDTKREISPILPYLYRFDWCP